MKPLEQIQTFFSWFNRQNTSLFDIHIRKPAKADQDYKTGQWIWITDYENISWRYIETKLLNWLRRENAAGSDIFFRPTRMTEHNILFLDDVSTDKAKAVMRKYSSCVVETHKDNTQIWLVVDKKLTKEQRKLAQQKLKNLGYTDPGSVSGDHLGRLPGVRSQKRNVWVNLIGTSEIKPWVPDLTQSPNPETFKGPGSSSQQHGVDTSPSGKEFGWVIGMLKSGVDQSVVYEKLLNAATARGKSNPRRYTEYTIAKALKTNALKER